MIVNRISFERFLDLIITKGALQVKEAVFKLRPQCVEVIAADESTRILAEYAVETGVSETIEIGIEDLAGFKKIIKSFKNPSISIEKKHNKLLISSETDKHTASITLTKSELMTEVPAREKVLGQIEKASTNAVVMTEELAESLISYADSLKYDVVGARSNVSNTIEFKFNKKNREEVTASLEFTGNIKPFETVFDSRLMDIIGTIASEMTLSINSDALTHIRTSEKDIIVNYLVAPIRRGE